MEFEDDAAATISAAASSERGSSSAVYLVEGAYSKYEGGSGTPGFDNKGYSVSSLNPDYEGISPSAVLTHEVGIHNMAAIRHKMDENGNAVYPDHRTLESNKDNIQPSDEDAKRLLEEAQKNGTVDYETPENNTNNESSNSIPSSE